MPNVSKCFSCAHKNDYDTKFGYYGCNLSGQECKGYSMFEPKANPKPTNADRIRSMSNEELAKFIDHALNPPEVHCIDCKWDSCWKCWKEWLEKEVTDEDEYEWREFEEL